MGSLVVYTCMPSSNRKWLQRAWIGAIWFAFLVQYVHSGYSYDINADLICGSHLLAFLIHILLLFPAVIHFGS